MSLEIKSVPGAGALLQVDVPNNNTLSVLLLRGTTYLATRQGNDRDGEWCTLEVRVP